MDELLQPQSQHATGPSSGASSSSGTPAVGSTSPSKTSTGTNGIPGIPASPLKGAFAALLPGRMRRSGSSGHRDTSPSRLGNMLTLVRSRERDGGPVIKIRSRDRDTGHRRAWSLNRTRSGTDGVGELPFIAPAPITGMSHRRLYSLHSSCLRCPRHACCARAVRRPISNTATKIRAVKSIVPYWTVRSLDSPSTKLFTSAVPQLHSSTLPQREFCPFSRRSGPPGIRYSPHA